MDFEQEFYATFGDKYNNLHLKEVVVKKREGVCTITFLYPSTDKDLSDADKKEITNWLVSALNLEQMQTKVKFMKAYVEEKLIRKAITTFFERKYRLVTSYLTDESFVVKFTPIDVVVEFYLNDRMNKFFVEHKISSELPKYLKDNFLTEFTIDLKENPDFVDEVDIENVEMKTAYRPAQRYKVEIVKEVVGKGIITTPEYVSFIKSPKNAVVVAGFIKKLECKGFVVKSGKRVGQERTYYTFQIVDDRGKLDCIYFCPKTYKQDMDALEECDYVLLHGDVKFNQMGKLCLYIDKLALATKPEKEEETMEEKTKFDGPVVEIQKLTALEQDTMFEHTDKYNQKIMGKTIVVFDIETTGLDPTTDQIIELGAVKIENGNIVERFSTFVKPTVRLSYEVSNLTHITDDMLQDAPPIELVIKDFYDFTRGCVLSGHNIIGFDIKFIRREGQTYGLNFDNELIDTLNEARTSKLKISRYNLGTVVKALGLTLEGAHRAWNDAYATAQVLLKLNEIDRK